ncbi:hypothetical protein HMPREF0765_0277 [Sphingobacterium spiritivorum ATCC 33300]|uniref:Uncharacterized protein n=1 Tax=Sphingobacterium spiritivorum ATCC 33300 TaxID=525372 RepID=C2FSH1_SPHSI|nr:hypothetical protein HMPREF0765_0277 [Sphingobacterium spiritivorum ATCC 33300]
MLKLAPYKLQLLTELFFSPFQGEIPFIGREVKDRYSKMHTVLLLFKLLHFYAAVLTRNTIKHNHRYANPCVIEVI